MNIQENLSAILFEGPTYDMAYLQVTTNSVTGYSKLSGMVPVAEEQLLLIRSGTATMQLKDSLHIIGAGSVAVILPGDTYTIQSYNRDSCWFYVIKYRSKAPVNKARGKAAGGSFVIDWNKTDSIPNNKGSRRSFFERSTAMCKRLEMHVSTLNADSSNHGPQTHRAAELTIMKEGIGELQSIEYRR
ncbi:hypothetical protein F5148DRAFT_1291096 [Russula earlei]|uniref:Uncharacterized protein n=1 Tax=Russula earlei TaxID=71964 RepID=A0ACC0TUP8_9AGAM|nr:hypothetical protein F5148DRAFT_1291096 [Russula earlei]